MRGGLLLGLQVYEVIVFLGMISDTLCWWLCHAGCVGGAAMLAVLAVLAVLALWAQAQELGTTTELVVLLMGSSWLYAPRQRDTHPATSPLPPLPTRP